MKAEELMIGDWVNLNFDIDYKTGTPIYGYAQVTGINKDRTIDTNCTFDNSESMQDGWDLKLIKPIPLTPEILEKNGFYRSEIPSRDEMSNFYIRKCDFSNIFVNMTFDDGRDFGSKLLYVHELQHVLKLCGIKKEIIL